MKIPENNVEMIQQPGGGWQILLDGYDLAPHIDHWEVTAGEVPSDAPFLTVRIPTGRLVTRDADDQPSRAQRLCEKQREAVVNVRVDGEDVAAKLRKALRPLGGDFR